ncbi:MAG TPA: carbohydrate ABC transporter permease [Candidatus Limnocylindrales bacterium]|nr:carbohydrate ABC transporter permease [Candidatus Limnocylindrales bacterium]
MRRRRWSAGTWTAYAIALVATVISLFPLYWLFVISTKTPREAFETPPQFIYIPDFSKYFEVWNSAGFADAYINSIQVVLLGVGLTLLVATPAAYAIIRFKVRGVRYLRFWLLLAYTTPEFLFVIPMYVLYQQLGVYDTVAGLAVIYQVFAIPFAVWLIQSFLGEVPKELGDSARVDGCSELQTLLKVYLPLAAPGLAATAILVGINMWNEVTIALSLTFDEARTVQIAVAGYRGYAAIRWQEMTAAAVMAVVPMIIFAGIAQRYIVKGLTFGAVK